MYKTYKFRIYPTEYQKTVIHKTLGCCRFVYNYYLTQIKNENYMNAIKCNKDYTNFLKYEYPFLTEIDSIVIKNLLFCLENAFSRYFHKLSDYPNLKNKHAKNSYTTTAIYRTYKDKKYCNIEIDLKNRKVKLPKLKWIKIRGYHNLNEITGRIVNATISREPNGKYYISILYITPDFNDIYTIPRSIVGLDLGIKKLVTLSDGTEFMNNKYIFKYEKRIKRIQKALSRKKKGSNNYYKCKQKLAILYSKLKNARNYYLHQITKQITDNYDIIITEKLNTKQLLQKKELSKSVQDAAFFELIRQLQYKAKWKNKYFYQVDMYYPSSQICSVCGNIDKKYKNLNERIYNCCDCYQIMDRDLNASINIMFEGIKLYMNQQLSKV